jgi:hypothetical protein
LANEFYCAIATPSVLAPHHDQQVVVALKDLGAFFADVHNNASRGLPSSFPFPLTLSWHLDALPSGFVRDNRHR